MSLPRSVSTVTSFHCVKPDYDTRSICNAIERGQLEPDDADLISLFIADMQVTRNIGKLRVNKLTANLVSWRRFIGPFRKNTIKDLYNGIERIKVGKTRKGNPFSKNTIYDHIAVLKQFYKWANEEGITDLPERKLIQIRNITRPNTKTAEDLLSPDEVTAILSSCKFLRDRALVSTLYEGGFRIGEIGLMKWRDLSFDLNGVSATVNFKTGKVRHVRLILAREHLSKWRSEYPGDASGDNLVFVTIHGRPMTYGAMARMIERAAERAGITKPFTPHTFRHSRITHLIQQGMSESVVKLMMWGDVNSRMFATYLHLCGSDVDREVAKLYGIDPDTMPRTNKKVEPKICPRCHEINSPISNHCSNCGQGLDTAVIQSDEELQQFIMEHKEKLIKFLSDLPV